VAQTTQYWGRNGRQAQPHNTFILSVCYNTTNAQNNLEQIIVEYLTVLQKNKAVMSAKRILVVDDNTHTLKIVRLATKDR
jgi:hypothetical protein